NHYPFSFSTIDLFLQKLSSHERYRDVLLDKSKASQFWHKRLPLQNFTFNSQWT
ncbi:MAG: hypothetical protein ACI97P_000488, partial [Arcticibacterium sp.]